MEESVWPHRISGWLVAVVGVSALGTLAVGLVTPPGWVAAVVVMAGVLALGVCAVAAARHEGPLGCLWCMPSHEPDPSRARYRWGMFVGHAGSRRGVLWVTVLAVVGSVAVPLFLEEPPPVFHALAALVQLWVAWLVWGVGVHGRWYGWCERCPSSRRVLRWVRLELGVRHRARMRE